MNWYGILLSMLVYTFILLGYNYLHIGRIGNCCAQLTVGFYAYIFAWYFYFCLCCGGRDVQKVPQQIPVPLFILTDTFPNSLMAKVVWGKSNLQLEATHNATSQPITISGQKLSISWDNSEGRPGHCKRSWQISWVAIAAAFCPMIKMIKLSD